MAVKAKKGVITAPVSNGGTVNTDLSAVFSASEPIRAILFFAQRSTAEEHVAGDSSFAKGFASNDGGSIQQVYQTLSTTNNVGTTENSYYRGNASFVIKLVDVTSATTATTLLTCAVTTFNDDDFTCTFATTSSGTKIHYLALGGADITAARCGDFATTAAVATQDVTINAGFGQPDLVLFSPGNATTNTDAASGNGAVGFAADTGGSDTRGSCTVSGDAANNAVTNQNQGSNIPIFSANSTNAVATLSGILNWPTDGFELSYSDQASVGVLVQYLALRGTFTKAVTDGTARTTTGTTTHSLASGTARAALMWGGALATAAGERTADADLGGFFFGATDGTDEGCVGWVENDGDTTQWSTRYHSESKMYRLMAGSGQTTAGGASAITAECDASFSGGNMDLNWTDADSVAREYQVVMIGEAAAAATPSLVWQPQTSSLYSR